MMQSHYDIDAKFVRRTKVMVGVVSIIVFLSLVIFVGIIGFLIGNVPK